VTTSDEGLGLAHAFVVVVADKGSLRERSEANESSSGAAPSTVCEARAIRQLAVENEASGSAAPLAGSGARLDVGRDTASPCTPRAAFAKRRVARPHGTLDAHGAPPREMARLQEHFASLRAELRWSWRLALRRGKIRRALAVVGTAQRSALHRSDEARAPRVRTSGGLCGRQRADDRTTVLSYSKHNPSSAGKDGRNDH